MQINFQELSNYLDWLKMKIILNQNAESAKKRIVKRGEVYECNFGVGVGSEERKKRPCVILQNDSANKSSSIVLVAPISHSERNSPVVIPIETQYNETGDIVLDGNVLIGNMTSVSKARLGNRISKLPKAEMNSIDEAIFIEAGLLPKINAYRNTIADKEKYIEKLKQKQQN